MEAFVPWFDDPAAAGVRRRDAFLVDIVGLLEFGFLPAAVEVNVQMCGPGVRTLEPLQRIIEGMDIELFPVTFKE